MKRKFTFLIAAAVMLLTMVATTGTMWGQTRDNVTLQYTGSTTTNMTGGNDAATLGLSATDWSVVGYKGGQNNYPGLNKDGTIRLYAGGTGETGNGAYIVVTNSNDNTITSITMNVKSGTATVLVGGNSVTGTNDTYTINSTSFTVKNQQNSGQVQINSITINYSSGGGTTPSISADDVEIAYDATSGSIVYEIENYEDGEMAASTEADWISNFTYQQADEIGEVGFTTSENESVSPRSATVTLTYTYGAKSTATRNVTVTQTGNPNASGGENNPYTVAEARAAIDAGTGTQGVYATGIVYQVDSYNSTYHSITYWISDDGTSTNPLEVYGGLGIDDETNQFNSKDDIQVNDIVVVRGNLIKYNTTYEFAQNNRLISLVRKVATPTFYPAAGAVALNTEITISCDTDEATIYYTTDGSDPTTNSSVYSDPIIIDAAKTIKAFAVKDNYTNSEIATATYTILAPAATPTFSPAAGTYTWAQSVTISTTTEGATIYYTTNGDNPTTGSTEYTAAIPVNATTTIKAIAAKEGLANSTVAEATYTMNIPAINASNVNLAYDATAGSIAYTMTNPVDGGVLTAAITGGNEGSWLTLGAVSAEAVALTCSANDGDADRSATVTLTYTYNTDKTVTKVVTVTQAHFVVDYATLPFNWDGGTSATLTAIAGVTANGLGTDYGDNNAPYRVKFDTDGDYIQVKTDSQPAKVIIGVKMIGGASTSKITVKASADGITFDNGEELTISGAQNDILNLQTTRSFGADVRFVRMVFTKGSNVGVGPITITKYTTDPIINAEDVSIACDATNGSIAYTISNPVDGGILTAAITAGNVGDWLTLGSVTTSVAFTCTANTEEENRTATVTLTYTYNTSETVTKDVTVTQSRRDFALLPFAYDGNGSGVLPCGLTQEGVGAYAAAPKMKFDDTGDYLILKLEGAPVSISYDIKGNSFSGGTFTVQVSANGSSYTDIETYTSLGDTQTITLLNSDDNVRYIKWVYTKKVNGNVALGNLNITTELIINGDCTVDNITISNTEVLTIEAGSVMTITGTLTNEGDASNLIIEDGGQVIVNNTGVQATFKKSVAHGGAKDAANWYTISSPVNNIATASVNNLIQDPATKYDLYYYDEATQMWKNHKANAITNMTNGRGYLYWNTDGDELSFPGELNSGNVEIAVTKTGTGNLAGFNLIGNPYSHNIYKGDGTAIPNSILSAGYYTLSNAGAWTAGTDNTTAIKPGQGILVKATAAGTVTMTNTTANGAKRNNEFIKFMIANSQYEDVAYALFNKEEGLNKINHRNADIPMLYIPQDGQNYAIATMSDETQSFNLNFKAMTTGQYTLSFKAEGKYDYLHVIDRMTGEDIDMLLNGEYSFIASPSDNDARFIVKLGYNTNNSAENDIFAFQNGSDIIVNGEGELQVFDVTGRMVATQHVNGVQTVNVPSQGVFIFKLNEKTQKIVVR